MKGTGEVSSPPPPRPSIFCSLSLSTFRPIIRSEVPPPPPPPTPRLLPDFTPTYLWKKEKSNKKEALDLLCRNISRYLTCDIRYNNRLSRYSATFSLVKSASRFINLSIQASRSSSLLTTISIQASQLSSTSLTFRKGNLVFTSSWYY